MQANVWYKCKSTAIMMIIFSHTAFTYKVF